MYAKVLIPGPPDVALLIATTSSMNTLLPQLLSHHWTPMIEEVAGDADGELRLDPGGQRLQLIVADQLLLDDDVNPVSPPGWWSAVDRMGGMCLVVVLRTADVDLTDPQLGASC